MSHAHLLNRLTNMVDGSGTTKYSYTAAGQLVTETGPFASDTVSNTYVNRLRVGLNLQQPTGSWTNAFAYDSARRFTSIASPAGTFDYSYPAGMQDRISSIQLPDGAYIINTYDPVARVASTLLKSSGNSTLDSARYGYNLAGLRTAYTNAAGTYVLYTNDAIGQLLFANSESYLYDAAWNLYQKNGYNYSFDSKNEMTSVGSFDLNGNMTNYGGYLGYTYDDENRLTFNLPLILVSLAEPSEPVVNESGSELHVGVIRDDYWAISSTVNYIYDGNRVIQERDGSNNPQVSYTRGPDLSGTLEGAGGIGGLLARSSGYSTGSWTNHDYYHADGNGNITCLVDANQSVVASYQYDPYGNTTSSGGSLASVNVYQFSSKEFHNNGTLYFYGYRMYDPAMQRWINRDPAEEVGAALVQGLGSGPYSWLGPDSPNDDEPDLGEAYSSANLYLFLMNNPEFWSDAFGLKWYNWPPIKWIRDHGKLIFWWKNRKHQGPQSTPSAPNHGGGCFVTPLPNDPVRPPHGKGVHYDNHHNRWELD